MDQLTARPRPTPSVFSEGFWAAARQHRLVVQRCDGCGLLRHYPQPMCPECHDDSWTWTPLSGRGTIYTFTVTHQAFHPAWADRVPFAVVTIELEEGVRMVTDLPPDDVDHVAIGAPVECWFEDHELADGTTFTFPRFRLAATA
ncbi:Zn-ribbon domain-containing OB-fold protein [Rhabdothermincola salaria]|uniref:Zn-ribbon domain-containing OB-fold protein n=1 Tax=Rhabdothermincola salaria TaxID=2903142 RepID=UPI001E2911AA|nr:OB-fold domain-containing protein [Rhabdothermincola salaria]MCD9622854.1 OB-fold domain-containing protein [Rhabdothermincola salaria]